MEGTERKGRREKSDMEKRRKVESKGREEKKIKSGNRKGMEEPDGKGKRRRRT